MVLGEFDVDTCMLRIFVARLRIVHGASMPMAILLKFPVCMKCMCLVFVSWLRIVRDSMLIAIFLTSPHACMKCMCLMMRAHM